MEYLLLSATDNNNMLYCKALDNYSMWWCKKH